MDLRPHFDCIKRQFSEQKFDFYSAEDAIRSILAYLDKLIQPFSGFFDTARRYEIFIQGLNLIMPVFYKQYNRFVSEYVNRKKYIVHCDSGCGNCCAHYVTSVEPFELIYIDHHLKKRSDYCKMLVDMFNRQMVFDEISDAEDNYDEDMVLYRYFLKNMFCPFLTAKQECGIYTFRAMPCRMFLSLSHPRYCRNSAVVDKENKNFIVELPDDIEVAISQISLKFKKYDIPVMLFSGLLKANEIFGKF